MGMANLKKSEQQGTEAVSDPPIRPVPYFLYFTVGFGAAVMWTLIGGAIAFRQGELADVVAEGQRLQGPLLIGLGTWLFLIARSGALESRARRITSDIRMPPDALTHPGLRALLIGTIAVVGTGSLIGLGFNGSGAVLVFMWITSATICGAAGFVTAHTVDLVLVVHGLEKAGIRTFIYAPARTPELRDLIKYFTSFTFILSVAYLFAFAATIKGHWTGNPSYIEAVQWFWPLVYVPICSVALIYPHVVMHRLILQAKERTLISYQTEIDKLLENYQGLKNDEVQRINTLAQIFDRINATPNYVIDFGIAIRTGLPLAFNLVILIAKPIIDQIWRV